MDATENMLRPSPRQEPPRAPATHALGVLKQAAVAHRPSIADSSEQRTQPYRRHLLNFR